MYTLSAADFGKVVANLNAPEIASVTGRRPDSFFALTTRIWPTMPPGRWYLVGGTTELPAGQSAQERSDDALATGALGALATGGAVVRLIAAMGEFGLAAEVTPTAAGLAECAVECAADLGAGL